MIVKSSSPAYLFVTIDAEEEFNWAQTPTYSTEYTFRHISHLYKLQRLLEEYKIIPLYLCTYLMITNKEGQNFFYELYKNKKAILGTHLHPWNTPPMGDVICKWNMFPGNLPPEQEYKKILCLTQAFKDNLLHSPLIYRAGCYGLGKYSFDNLIKCGYASDSSMSPSFTYSEHLGPDYSVIKNYPYNITCDSGNIVSIPVTGGFTGILANSSKAADIGDSTRNKLSRLLRLPGLFSRLNLLRRLRLSPEGYSLNDLCKLTHNLYKQGTRIFVMSLHSPSLMPGNTPYTSDARSLQQLLQTLEQYIIWFNDTLKCITQMPFSTMREFSEGKFTGINTIKGRHNSIIKLPGHLLSNNTTTAPPTKVDNMRVLIVTSNFYPSQNIAALRTTELAKYLMKQGIIINIVTNNTLLNNHNMNTYCNFPKGSIHRTGDGTPEQHSKLLQLLKYILYTNMIPKWLRIQILDILKYIYRYMVLFPDKHKGWREYLSQEIHSVCSCNTPPDIIYISAPPFSQISTTISIARKYNIPVIAEMRDLWCGELYPFVPWWRAKIDCIAEYLSLRSVNAIVTVSDVWRKYYADKYRCPTLEVRNGYTPSSIPKQQITKKYRDPLCIIYAGSLYPQRRDFTPLLLALAKHHSPSEVILEIYTEQKEYAYSLIQKTGTCNFVRIFEPVAHEEIMLKQRMADLLLILQWDNPSNTGNIPAKLFELLALRRPILCIGPDNGIPARVIRDGLAGITSSNLDGIGKYVSLLIKEKRLQGHTSETLSFAHRGMQRDKHFNLLYQFLRQWIDN